MIRLKKSLGLLVMISTLLVASSSFAEQSQKDKDRDKARCEKLLKLLDEDLKAVKAEIIADAGPISHATALLAGATISYQFGRFAGCIDKTTRGRKKVAPYIKKSK
ncbi:MAG: hypothetical protein KAU29_10300 [Gammaproteobacteria bacterium]|nr:hypothetical protein [Gammaproteobacteria bacterium]